MPSSVIRTYRYDSADHRLHVEFVTGRAYSYVAVPPAVVRALDRAPSKGGYFNRNIRDHYAYIRCRQPLG